MAHEIGTKLKAVLVQPFPSNEEAPRLIKDNVYELEEVCFDSGGNPHYHVGLVSELNWVTSQETGEVLPDSDKKHWCHPSRFEVAD